MFRNKEYVLTIYREGSFTKAAEKLFVSQPSLSASVKRIEEKVGSPIFDRSTSPITLTEVGREYVSTAQELDAMEESFRRYISDRASLVKGKIRIGGSSFFSAFVLPKMISDFKLLHDGISFEVHEDSTKNLMVKLNTGELDIVVDNTVMTDDEIVSERYMREMLLLAVPRALAKPELSEYAFCLSDIKAGTHAEREPVDLRVYADAPFILLHRENDTGKRADAIFKSAGISPKVAFMIDQQVTAYNISSSGIGISFVSDTLVKHIGDGVDMVYYNLPPEHAKRSIYFFRKKNHYQPLACRSFIEYSISNAKS